MNLNKIAASALAVGLVFMSTSAYSNDVVIGKVDAKSTITLNPGAAQQRYGSKPFPYIQGDIVSTVGADAAQIILSSGDAQVRLAPESVVSIDDASPLALTLHNGAIDFVSQAGMDVTINSAKGSFTLTSESDIDAVAVLQDGELAVMPRTGSVSISHSAGNSFSVVDAGNAFVSSQTNEVEVVEVLAGGTSILTALLAAAAVIAGIIIIDEISDDDDDEAPAASPS